MDPEPYIHLIAKHKLCRPSYTAICGDIKAFVTMEPSLLLANTKEIHLIENDVNKKCLELAKKGRLEVPYHLYSEIMLKCSEMFAIEVSVDLVYLAMEIMLTNNQNSLAILDEHFTISDVLKVFKTTYDHLSDKASGKINRKLKRYLKSTKRSEADKKLLNLVYESQKDSNQSNAFESDDNNVPVNTTNNQQNQPQNQPQQPRYRRENRQQDRRQQTDRRDNWRGSRNGHQNRREWSKRSQERNTRSTGKEKNIDKRILLGINGDTQDGWRARYRPERVPKGAQIYRERQLEIKIQEQKKTNEVRREPQVMKTQQVRREMDTSNSLKSIFSFPRQGTKFDFSKMKDFMLFINGSFWIKYVSGTLSISKGEQSFVRKSDLTFVDDTGFMGEGLTLSLDGFSNLEDGGQQLGDAKISTFTLSDSQFFHVVTMEVYQLKPA